MPHLIQCLAGPVAEMLENEGASHSGAFAIDFSDARRYAAAVYCEFTKTPQACQITPEEVDRHKDQIGSLVQRAVIEAGKLVDEHWKAIVRVRDLLLRERELSGEEVASIVNRV